MTKQRRRETRRSARMNSLSRCCSYPALRQAQDRLRTSPPARFRQPHAAFLPLFEMLGAESPAVGGVGPRCSAHRQGPRAGRQRPEAHAAGRSTQRPDGSTVVPQHAAPGGPRGRGAVRGRAGTRPAPTTPLTGKTGTPPLPPIRPARGLRDGAGRCPRPLALPGGTKGRETFLTPLLRSPWGRAGRVCRSPGGRLYLCWEPLRRVHNAIHRAASRRSKAVVAGAR